MSQNKYALTIFSLTMITVGSVDSIRNLPLTALFGSKLITFFALGAIFFLIPTALISAELASGWAIEGGIYIWVKTAFGKRLGFLAIWLQWIENVMWYPLLLSFVAGTVGYLINPALADNPIFLWGVVVAAFWGATLVNLRGMHSSGVFATICTLSGLLLPMTLIISLGAIWLISGNVSHIRFDAQSILPHWGESDQWVALTGIMMSFCGIEIATVHANDVENPQKAFPRVLAYAVVIILSTLILGSLAIAIVLPHDDINLVAGIMQAFEAFFGQYGLSFMMPLVAMMLVLGGLGSVSNWIIAPTKGLLVAAEDGNMPAFFQKTNRHEAPIVMLVAQALIVTLLSSIFLFMPSVNGSYWLLTSVAAGLYMLMYIMMFAAAIKLRWSQPDHPRSFRVPGGKYGLLSVALVGTLGALTTLFVSFIPPTNIDVGTVGQYQLTLVSGLGLMCLPPFIISRLVSRRDKWLTT